jgi:hypothetical protein
LDSIRLLNTAVSSGLGDLRNSTRRTEHD